MHILGCGSISTLRVTFLLSASPRISSGLCVLSALERRRGRIIFRGRAPQTVILR
jgi:hypothetical protein